MRNLKIVFSKSSHPLAVGTVMDKITYRLRRMYTEVSAEPGEGRTFILPRCGIREVRAAMDKVMRKEKSVKCASIGPYHRTPV